MPSIPKYPAIPVGTRCGRWTVIGDRHVDASLANKSARYLCRCECGTERVVPSNALKGATSLSCGCLQREVAANLKRSHGQSDTRLFGIWKNMLRRCDNPTVCNYHRYGGRGITAAPEWRDFFVFKAWAEEAGYLPDLELDRTDNDGPYSPANCAWVTHKANMRNTMHNHWITAFGEVKCLHDWSLDPRCAVTRTALAWRLGQGIDAESAITSASKKPYMRSV